MRPQGCAEAGVRYGDRVKAKHSQCWTSIPISFFSLFLFAFSFARQAGCRGRWSGGDHGLMDPDYASRSLCCPQSDGQAGSEPRCGGDAVDDRKRHKSSRMRPKRTPLVRMLRQRQSFPMRHPFRSPCRVVTQSIVSWLGGSSYACLAVLLSAAHHTGCCPVSRSRSRGRRGRS